MVTVSPSRIEGVSRWYSLPLFPIYKNEVRFEVKYGCSLSDYIGDIDMTSFLVRM